MSDEVVPHRRRVRYAGKYPRRFEDKYKERDPAKYPDVALKVVASGKTLAGTHRPIMVREVLEILDPAPGQVAVDATLGYGGHTREFLTRGVRVVGLDVDAIELPKTEARLRTLGFGPDVFTTHRSNFAGLPKVLVAEGLAGADMLFADLGVSSMQIDDPTRGFSLKHDGPLDMRMNPQRGQSAAALLEDSSPATLSDILARNADEPRAEELGHLLAGRSFNSTTDLARTVRAASSDDETVRRVFQALRIAVNDELGALQMLLRHLPSCLNTGGRVAILTFHSGEDRLVKKAFASGLRDGLYSTISRDVIRASPEERRANTRSASAKLRWAIRA